MTAVTEDILDRVIAGRLIGSLSSAVDPTPWQARILVRGTEQDGVWISPIDESAKHSLNATITAAGSVELSLAIDHERYAIQTQIIRRDRHFWLTQEMMFNAVLLRGPLDLKRAERRAHLRFRVPDGTSTFAQISSGSTLFSVRVRPWDVSAGGISFLCPRDAAILKLRANDVLNFVVSYRGRTVAGGGNVRFTRLITERVVKVGVQFDSSAMDTLSNDNLRYLLDDVTRLERARH